jgi:hypothetical protein
MPDADTEKRAAYHRAWQQAHPEKHRANQARYARAHGSVIMVRRIRLEGQRALEGFTA